MSFKVEVISKETIKPSSPTPRHLRTFKLSLLDQCMYSFYLPLILFFPASDDNFDRLKKSLSEILTRFYPLAGRVVDNKMIDCNDQGISLVRARVSCNLSQVVDLPINEKLVQLIPNDDLYTTLHPTFLVSIQANTFDCGGTALGVCMSHKVGDVSSLSLFLKAWASLSRGDNDDQTVYRPDFRLASLCPPKDDIPFNYDDILSQLLDGNINNIRETVISKRFVLDASKIDALKAKICSTNIGPTPTRVQAVSALMWRCFINLVRQQRKISGDTSINRIGLMLPVNLRARMVPAQSNLFGNISIATVATTPTIDDDAELDYLVGLVREAIRKMGEYVRELFQADDGDGVSRYYDSIIQLYEQEVNGEIKNYTISSWCKFDMYEIDFGFGKPIWISTANTLGAKDLIILMDTKCGTGIELGVTLEEEDMAIFEHDLIAFTSPAPAPAPAPAQMT